ncbi:MAG TPA: hypothetical protein VI365_16535, partial [Trebonia sp.]
AGAGSTGLAAVIALAALSLSGNHSTGILQAWVGLSHPTVTASSGGASAGAAPGKSPAQDGTASASLSPTPAATTAAPRLTPSAKPSATTSASAKPSARPSGIRPSGGPASSPPTTAAAVQSGLSVSATSLTLQEHQGVYVGSLTLTNPAGGAIDWSVSIPDGSHLAVWGPRSAQLQPGRNVTLYIYQQSGGGSSQPSTAVVTIDPGNIQVSVTIP